MFRFPVAMCAINESRASNSRESLFKYIFVFPQSISIRYLETISCKLYKAVFVAVVAAATAVAFVVVVVLFLLMNFNKGFESTVCNYYSYFFGF